VELNRKSRKKKAFSLLKTVRLLKEGKVTSADVCPERRRRRTRGRVGRSQHGGPFASGGEVTERPGLRATPFPGTVVPASDYRGILIRTRESVYKSPLRKP